METAATGDQALRVQWVRGQEIGLNLLQGINQADICILQVAQP